MGPRVAATTAAGRRSAHVAEGEHAGVVQKAGDGVGPAVGLFGQVPSGRLTRRARDPSPHSRARPAKLALVDADALLHRLLFDLLQDELAEWPSPRVLELLEEAGASQEQAVALRVRAVQMQGEFLVAWTRAGADRD